MIGHVHVCRNRIFLETPPQNKDNMPQLPDGTGAAVVSRVPARLDGGWAGACSAVLQCSGGEPCGCLRDSGKGNSVRVPAEKSRQTHAERRNRRKADGGMQAFGAAGGMQDSGERCGTVWRR
ncbi:hypothetical protein AAFF_G00137720 [Aldrovandia affinis]|uniref:Uncharacterized protein n=1 Tax=Aldrovandia affinis TaxID=143900 RepID=A0AAD7X2R4_9TELE|nr:hypothetical protein AAFF_G00137720 [Aldrovandia affinis]